MITSTEVRDNWFDTTSEEPSFDVSVPNNPLVPSAPVSVTKVKNGIQLVWEIEKTEDLVNESAKFPFDITIGVRKDVSRAPESARAHTNLALALMRVGQNSEAIEEFIRALELSPNDYLTGVSLAGLYVRLGRFADAHAIYSRLMVTYPKNDTVLLSLSYLSLRDNHVDKAEELLSALLANKPSGFAYFLFGIAQLHKGNIERAIGAIRQASRLEVRRAVYHNTLGVAYALINDFSRAEKSLLSAHQLAPNDLNIAHSLGETLLAQRERWESAEIFLGAHVERHSTDIEGRELYARVLINLGKYKHARSQLLSIMGIRGSDIPASEKARHATNMAVTFYCEGNLEAARRKVMESIDVSAASSSAPYELLGRIYIDEKNFDDAILSLAKAKRSFQKCQSIRRLIAIAYSRMDEFAHAIEELRELWESGEAELDTLLDLGWLYSWRGEFEVALKVSKEAQRQFPKDSSAINNVAYMHLMLGQVGQAREVLKLASIHPDPHPELIATFGLLRLLEGDRIAAQSLYDKAVDSARSAGRQDLAKRLRQKWHLELARFLMRKGMGQTARHEIRNGLAISPDTYSYTKELKVLGTMIEKLSSVDQIEAVSRRPHG